MSPHLEVSGLIHHYGGAQSLRGVSFALNQGECLALLGRNGAGKTTLLRCLTGVYAATSGAIKLDGQEMGAWPSHMRSRAGVGYVPQGREIFSDLTVGENLQIAAKAHGLKGTEAEREVVQLFPVLGEMRGRRGGDLSGGQQQQLAIGRALMGRPKLLILDEPTEGVQPNVVKQIEHAIASLKGRISILLVEQYYDFARTLADRYVVLERGAVAASGLGADLERDGVNRFLSI